MDAAAKDQSADPGARRAVYLDRAEDISPMLKLLRDHGAEIELRLAGVDSRYTGRVLDLTAREFLLENIRPRDGLSHLKRGVTFSFSARVDDIYVTADDCRITRVEAERGLPYFHANMPKRLLRQRRRRHTRITLPPRVSPNDGMVTVYRKRGNEPLNGSIIDVSVGGCRVAFGGAVVPPYEADEVMPLCEVRITSTLSVSATGVIRHSSWDASQGVTTCGVEFSEMSIPDRRRLEHYVSQLAGRAGPSKG